VQQQDSPLQDPGLMKSARLQLKFRPTGLAVLLGHKTGVLLPLEKVPQIGLEMLLVNRIGV